MCLSSTFTTLFGTLKVIIPSMMEMNVTYMNANKLHEYNMKDNKRKHFFT